MFILFSISAFQIAALRDGRIMKIISLLHSLQTSLWKRETLSLRSEFVGATVAVAVAVAVQQAMK